MYLILAASKSRALSAVHAVNIVISSFAAVLSLVIVVLPEAKALNDNNNYNPRNSMRCEYLFGKIQGVSEPSILAQYSSAVMTESQFVDWYFQWERFNVIGAASGNLNRDQVEHVRRYIYRKDIIAVRIGSFDQTNNSLLNGRVFIGEVIRLPNIQRGSAYRFDHIDGVLAIEGPNGQILEIDLTKHPITHLRLAPRLSPRR